MVHHLVDGLSTAWLTRARRNIQDPFNRHKRTPLAIMWQPAGAAPIMYHQQQQQKKGSVATTTMTASKNMIVSWFLMATVVTNVHANDSGTIQRMFPDCDPSTYYENSKNGMDWDRGTVALLLSKTHRQIVPLVDNNGRSIIGAPSTSTSTTAWEALQNVDAGQGRNGMATVNMIFTQTEMDASQKGTGWEPGHLWALKGDIDNPQNTRHEWQAAVSDLHNLRPRHPNLHRDSALQSVYYGNCFDCFVDSPTEEDTMFHNTRAGQRDSENRQRTGTGGALASAEELCLCQQERSLQPPEAARGEIARALLYMDLRYGTPTTASDGLGLFLSDCHPDSPISNEDVDTSRRMGYFSRLVQWHLEYPPTDAERERNDKVCHLYQGNRNPFVDFYEDSWSLLNFEVVEEEECLEVPVEEPAEEEEEEEEDITAGRLEDDDNANNHMCDTLMAGDLNFNMVDAAENSFGVVTLWNLPAGMELFVTNNVWTGGAFDTSEGTVKLTIPDGGIPAGKSFGFGDLLYLGDQWELPDDAPQMISMKTDGDQLFLYCTKDSTPNVIAALSTSGQAFVNLPDSLQHVYGVLVLPSSIGSSSAKWRYVGPAYTKHDMYAKALIDVSNWRGQGSEDVAEMPPRVPPEVQSKETSTITFEDESIAESSGGESDVVILPPRRSSGMSVSISTVAFVCATALVLSEVFVQYC